MENVHLTAYAIFYTTTLAAIVLLYKALGSSKIVITLSLIWLGMQGIVAYSGFYMVTSGPPRFPLLLGPPLVAIFIFVFFKLKRSEHPVVSLKWLTLMHCIRIPVEIVIYFLFLNKAVPQSMTFEGSNPDLLSGLTAPVVWWLYQRGSIGRKVLIAWNVVCLCLLLNIVIRAILSAPLPFQQFAFDQPNIAVLYFPFVFLPCYIVPVVLFSHLIVLFQIPFKTLKQA